MITPQSLQEELAKRAAAAKDTPRCYTQADRPISFIEFRPDPHRCSGFAVSQLLQYTLDTDPPKLNSQTAPPERLELGFATADVMVRGARLAPLVELLVAHKLAAVEAVATDTEARYANLHPSEPWVSAITIARLDRPGGAQT